MTGGNETNESILSCDLEIKDAGIKNHIHNLDNKAQMPPVYITSPTNNSASKRYFLFFPLFSFYSTAPPKKMLKCH